MKVRITVDIFSGRPNPTWEIDEPQQVGTLLQHFSDNQAALARPDSAAPGKLGLRGVHVQVLEDGESESPAQHYLLAAAGPRDPALSAQLAEQLIRTIPDDAEQFPQEFWDAVLEEVRGWPTAEAPSDSQPDQQETREASESFAACPYDTAPFDPAAWNTPSIQPYNNCYNYATNVVTGTFAQPGRAHGYTIPSTVTCAQVSQGAQIDGYRVWGNCQPPGTTNRWVVAMVTGTFPGGVRDYHWYRFQSEGFWGHKPGQTRVINTDNSGNIIRDPQTCNRGYYTDWCGYFQCSNNVVIK